MGRKPGKNYFGPEIEQYVVDYLNETDEKVKNKIFKDKLYEPIKKIAEQTIRHGYGNGIREGVGGFRDLAHDLTTHLSTKVLEKFDPSRGTKAYSYLTQSAVNFLLQTRNFEKRFVNVVEDDEFSADNSLTAYNQVTLLKETLKNQEQEDPLEDFIDELIQTIIENQYELSETCDDIEIYDIIIKLLRGKEGNISNKPLLAKRISEFYGEKSDWVIDKAINKLKPLYKTLQMKYHRT